VGVCRGRYAPALVAEWHAWDARHGSENDAPDAFPDDQVQFQYSPFRMGKRHGHLTQSCYTAFGLTASPCHACQCCCLSMITPQ